MLILCPNHHLQFDRGILRLRKVAETYFVKSNVKGDSLDGRAILLRHSLDDDCVRWHYNWFASRRTL